MIEQAAVFLVPLVPAPCLKIVIDRTERYSTLKKSGNGRLVSVGTGDQSAFRPILFHELATQEFGYSNFSTSFYAEPRTRILVHAEDLWA